MMTDNADQVDPSPSLNTNEDPTQHGSNKRKILDIIDHQFDLEIYLKHREVATIQKEIENAHATLQDLEQAIKNEILAATLPELPHFTRQSAAAFYHGTGIPSANSTPPTPRRKAARPANLNQDQVLYGRRIDGVYVKLGCPVCHRHNFTTQLGLLNHCRITHMLEFGYYENVMAQCGTPVDESEVPEDHPIRTRPLALPIVPAPPIKKIERPTIKEYEEEVDLELEQGSVIAKRMNLTSSTSTAVPASSTNTLQPTMQTTNDEGATFPATAESSPSATPMGLSPVGSPLAPAPSTLGLSSSKENESFSPAILNALDPSSSFTASVDMVKPLESVHPNQSTPQIPTEAGAAETPAATTPTTATPTATTPTATTSTATAPTTTTPTATTPTATTPTATTPTATTPTATTPTATTPTATTPTATTSTTTAPTATTPTTTTPTATITPSALPSQPSSAPLTPVSEIPEEDNSNTKTESLTSAIAEKGSRFYIKRRILVGNVSKYIHPEKRDPTLKNYTHKWMMYIVEPPQEQDKARFLTGVRYHLHPSYKPYDVVDVTEPPFRLTRLGWGEFPIRLQLYFVDKRRNKSLDMIHHLKLDYTLSGQQLLGSERGFDIELDRNTNFDDVTLIPSDPTSPPITTPSSPTILNAALGQQHLPLSAGKQRLTLLQGILKESVLRFPVVLRAGSQLQPSLPYTCALDNKQFWMWHAPKRKALEWHRGHLLRCHVQQRCRDTKDEVLQSASDTLTTKEVVYWCRAQGYTPIKDSDDSNTNDKSDNNINNQPETTAPSDKDKEKGHMWCRYCGSEAHVDCPKKPTGWQKKRSVLGDQHTLSDVKALLTSLGLDVKQEPKDSGGRRGKREEDEDNDVDVDVDVDMDLQNDATSSTTYHHPISTPATSHLPITTNETTRTSAILLQRQVLLSRLRESAMETGDERTLDWMWSVIAQLRLKGMIGNELSLSRHSGQLHFQRPDVPSVMDLDAAMDQRLVVGQLFVQITKLFLKKLLDGGVDIWRKERGNDDQANKLLVPYHIHQAAKKIPSMDFLTGAYMGVKTTQSESTDGPSPPPPPL